MDSYIEDQRHGGQLDSEGSFTVDAMGALRKTLASALPEPHYYLFQIAQGLVAGGARDVEIAIGRYTTRFRFRDPQGSFADLAAARERLGQGLTLSSPRPLDLLLTGMATAVGSEMDRAELYAVDSNRSLRISLESANLVDRPAQGEQLYRDRGRGQEGCPVTPGSTYLELHRTVSMGLSFAWTRIWGARGEESELQRRFEFATPALKIAGLYTEPGSDWRQEVPLVAGVGRLVLLEAVVIDKDNVNHRGPRMLAPGDPGESPVRRLCRRAFSAEGEPMLLDEHAPDWERRAWTFFGTGSAQVESTVWWIRNGMTVEKTMHDLGLPGLLVLASAADLDIDASGYSLVRNDKFDRCLQRVSFLAQKTLGSVSRESLAQALSRPQVLKSLVQEGEAQTPSVDSLLAEFPWCSR